MEKVILTNMCMILDELNESVLLINRKKSWPGNAFPGGHVKTSEAIVPSVIREIKEETGLDIYEPHLVSVRDWYIEETNERTVSFLFVTTKFEGNLKESDEGEIYWVKVKDLETLDFAKGFKDQLHVFFENKTSEIYSYTKGKITTYKYY